MKKTSTIILLLLLAVSVSFAQSKKQETIKKHFNNNKKIEKTAVKTPNSTTTATQYDFTTGSDKFYGGTAGATEVEAGVWGMIAGDTDGSGVVDAADRSNTWNDRNQTGYLSSDVTLSGVTDAGDRSQTWNNRNKSTQVP